MDKDEIIKQLQEENSSLKIELEYTKTHLKKYIVQDTEKNNKKKNVPLSLLDNPDYATIFIFIGG
jgi:hypothetical protein